MCLLLETIRIAGNEIQALPYHNQRANRARRELLGVKEELDLGRSIEVPVGVSPPGPVKCRVLYARDVRRVEYLPYRLPVVHSLALVHNDDVAYAYKFADRSALDKLRRRKGKCDDILIIRRGLVTDTSFSNVVFFDGKQYITPARPLLAGTRRRALLDNGTIKTAAIAVGDMKFFSALFLINSMIGLEDNVSLPIHRIIGSPEHGVAPGR
jgi:4-amino-4-deoxychorismate lyase